MNEQSIEERKRATRDYMNDSHRRSWSILRSLTEADLGIPVYQSEENEWSVKNILAHLADAETGLLGQARRIAKGEETLPADFDINRWNRSAVRKRSDRPFREHLSIIEATFGDAIQFLEEVEPHKLEWRGRHSSGAMLTLEEYFHRIVDHRLEHASDMKEAIDGRDV